MLDMLYIGEVHLVELQTPEAAAVAHAAGYLVTKRIRAGETLYEARRPAE